mmetsp:Transcript_31857/g.83156  ORF Transcript_31857/g.83156 Transcript_31857/m.83156 type:complete len:489 (-) Transcript_31857:225-1691(-)
MEAAAVFYGVNRSMIDLLNCSHVYGPKAVDTVTTTATLATSTLALICALFVVVGVFSNTYFRSQLPLRIIGYVAITDCLIAINLLLNSIFCLTIDVALIEVPNLGREIPAAYFVYPFGYIANASNWMVNALLAKCVFEASEGKGIERRERRFMLITLAFSLLFSAVMGPLTFALPPVLFLNIRSYVFIVGIFGTYACCLSYYIRAIVNLRRLSASLFPHHHPSPHSISLLTGGGGGKAKNISTPRDSFGGGGSDGRGSIGGGKGRIFRGSGDTYKWASSEREKEKENEKLEESASYLSAVTSPPSSHSAVAQSAGGSNIGGASHGVNGNGGYGYGMNGGSITPTHPGPTPSTSTTTSLVQKQLISKVRHLSMFLLPYIVCACPTGIAVVWSLCIATPTDWTKDSPPLRTFSIIADLCYSMLGLFTLLLLANKLLVFYCGGKKKKGGKTEREGGGQQQRYLPPRFTTCSARPSPSSDDVRNPLLSHHKA